MSNFFDALETRNPADRESAQMSALAVQVAHAQKNSSAYAQILKGIDAAAVTSRASLAQLPVTRKSELFERQRAARETSGAKESFGGFSTVVRGPNMPRVFASPGPIYEPDGASRDYQSVGA